MIRLLLQALAPAGSRSRLSVLIFHRVHGAPDELFPGETHALSFDRQLAWLKRWFNVLPLADAVAGLRSGSLPARPAVITFDDGYADNHDVALPILQRHGLTATFFVASGFLDGGRMWNDTVIEAVRRCAGPMLDLDSLGLGRHAIESAEQRRSAISKLIGSLKYLEPHARQERVEAIAACIGVALPDDLMMSSAQVRQLARAGMNIGGHTVNHPILARLDDEAARAEIREGKRALESIIGAPVRHFAYPNGKPGEDYTAAHVAMVREAGFEAAVSTAWGAAASGCDLYQIPRFTPWDRSAWRYALRLAGNLLRSDHARV